MTVRRFKRETALRIGTILLLICIFARIAQISLYSYATFYQELNSDSASDILHAQMIVSQGHLLFADNWYVSTELHVLGVNILPTILFYFGLSSRLVWALTCGIGAIFISIAVYFAMRMLRLERFESLLASLLILLPTGELALWTYIHPSYQAFLVLLILLIAFLTELIATNTRRWQICALGVLVSFLCGICGSRLIIQGMLPVLLFLAYRFFRKHARDEIHLALAKDAIAQNWTVLLCFAGMAAGYILYEFVLCDAFGHGKTWITFAAVQEISQNLLRVPEALLVMYGLPYEVNTIGKGIAFAIQIVFILTSLSCCIWLIASRNRLDIRKSTSVKIAAVLSLFSFFMLCLMHAPEADGPTWRYVALGAYSLLLAIPLAISNWNRRSLRYVLAIAIALLAFAYPGYRQAREISEGLREPYHPPEYICYLEENHYTFGEATFWNANVNTVLSDGEIAIKPVFNDEKLSFYTWLTHKDYIDREAEFLLMTQEEYEQRLENGWQTPYKLVFSDEDYMIFADSEAGLP